MIAEIGLFLCVCALLAGLFGHVERAIKLQCICLSGAFITLVTAFIISDFSIALVADHSHTLKPLLYKVSGTWGNHEGSWLLLTLVISLYGLWMAQLVPNMFKQVALRIQLIIVSIFVAYLIFTSNPFARAAIIPVDGLGLNPLLQDWALAVHPPLFYVGIGGVIYMLSVSLAWIISHASFKDFLIASRAPILLSWCFLTLGVGMGSFWAYYELGWGGFWFWDPVENLALLPWLSMTGLLHSVMIIKKAGRGIFLTLGLIYAAAISVFMSFFLVRSGVLISVHSFANAPERGLVLGGVFAVVTLVPLIIFVKNIQRFMRVQNDARGRDLITSVDLVGRENGYKLLGVLMLVVMAIIAVGTVYPIIVNGLYDQQSVIGPLFYNAALAPIALLVLFITMTGPWLRWQAPDYRQMLKMIIYAFLIAMFVALAVHYHFPVTPTSLAFCLMAAWLMVASVMQGYDKVKARSYKSLGMPIAHFALGFAMMGIIGGGLWHNSETRALAMGDHIGVYRLDSINAVIGPNYTGVQAQIGDLRPERRHYLVSGQQTAEADFKVHLFYDIYATLGLQSLDDQRVMVTVSRYPYMSFLWLGIILMTAGGVVALCKQFKKKRT